MTEESAGNSSMPSGGHRCSRQKYKKLRNIDKNSGFFREKVVNLWMYSTLDKGPRFRYIMSKFIHRLNCDDEESKPAVKSKASRGGCKPGESRRPPKITSELQPEMSVGAAGAPPLLGDAYVGMQ